MIRLKGRTIEKTVQAEEGLTILQLAIKHKVDWGHACTRGNCARCRCFVEKGQQYLSEVNDAEERRLDPEEIEEGFRLGCQAQVISAGEVIALNKTYF